jgi:hypothetical protein
MVPKCSSGAGWLSATNLVVNRTKKFSLMKGLMNAQGENQMKRILALPLAMLATLAITLPALAAPAFILNAKGPITLAGIACPVDAPVGAECYSIAGSLTGTNKQTVAFTGTLETSGTPSTTKSGPCYVIFNSSTETATIATDVVSINIVGQACIQTKKGVASETLKSGSWVGITSLESGTGKETWTIAPTDDLSTTAPLAGTGTVKINGTLAIGG